MAQAHEARDRLCAAWPTETVEIVPVIASGDRIQDRPLAEIGGKALWTKELDGWLASGEIDFAVHSMKDVETIRPAELAIAAVLPRADVRDVLVGAESVAAIPGARVGTSAPRRARRCSTPGPTFRSCRSAATSPPGSPSCRPAKPTSRCWPPPGSRG
jgi:hydroxymethylbilane synthase